MTPEAERLDKLLDLTPQTSDELARKMGYFPDHNNRAIRELVRELNEGGRLVVSGPEGFRLPASPEEVTEYAQSLLRRAAKIIHRAEKLLEAVT